MASRRPIPPPSSGNRPKGSAMQPPSIRSKNSNAVLRAADVVEKEQQSHIQIQEPGPSVQSPGPLSPTKRAALLAKLSERDGGTNIQVVIRCRFPSPREIDENSPGIINPNLPEKGDLTIETGIPTTTLGVFTAAPTRTYAFDRVFGPEADQAMIFYDVVEPILEEVLAGYNCTIFAYGQTGTGKTYTMQGNLAPSHTGHPPADAGMIPRVLSKLFSHLNDNVPDYSVKVSYVELYNEELRDLLAQELATPVGNMQPMGLGQGGGGGLKIFDEAGAGRKGVLIQGLEEMGVGSAEDAIALLRKGSHRRQIAATKFNDHSSRSHTVFTLTVHTREPASTGIRSDDLLRVGKLHLVDLAGSENIGRSGAVNNRAREAGMINQSLLTLGRVINALVEKNSHVPYRESKLTRLLQDSLGGRTKTCIIATVSPALSNYEETVSTLEYAMRARSIKNKPEVNSRMTKNGLLKEYVEEIAKLKADLLCAREKNGVWFEPKRWEEIAEEHLSTKNKLQANMLQMEVINSQMRSVKEEYDHTLALLERRERELEEIKELFRIKSVDLEKAEEELVGVREALEEETIVKRALERGEERLDKVAGELKGVVEASLSDVEGLFEKLARKSRILTSNTSAVVEHSRTIGAETTELDAGLEEFVKQQHLLAKKIQKRTEQFHISELETISSQASRLEDYLRTLNESIELIRSKETSSGEAVAALGAAVKESMGSLRNGFEKWENAFRTSHNGLMGELSEVLAVQSAKAEKAVKSVGAHFEQVIRETRDHFEQERKSLQQVQHLVEQSAATEIARLKHQNALLTRLVDSEKAKSEQTRNELLSQVSSLLVNFTDSRDRSLREAIGEVQNEVKMHGAEVEDVRDKHGDMMEGIIKTGEALSEGLQKRMVQGGKARDSAVTALSSIVEEFNNGATKANNTVTTSLQAQASDIDHQSKSLASISSKVMKGLDRDRDAKAQATDSIATGARLMNESLQQSLSSTAQHIKETVGTVVTETTQLRTSVQTYHAQTSSHVSNLRQSTQALVEHGAKQDTSTGSTPRKRKWVYVDHWETTDRETVLTNWREGKSSSKVPKMEENAEVDVEVDVKTEEASVEDGYTNEGELPLSKSTLSVSRRSIRSVSASQSREPAKKELIERPPSALGLVERPTNIVQTRGRRRR